MPRKRSPSFTRGPLLYCKDAFEGLHAMDDIAGGKIDRGRAAAAQARRSGGARCAPKAKKNSGTSSPARNLARRSHGTIPFPRRRFGAGGSPPTFRRGMRSRSSTKPRCSPANGDSSKRDRRPRNIGKSSPTRPIRLLNPSSGRRWSRSCSSPRWSTDISPSNRRATI